MVQRGGEAWTLEDVQMLESMFRDGRNSSEIAAVLGRTQPSVSARLSTMKRRRMWGPSYTDDS